MMRRVTLTAACLACAAALALLVACKSEDGAEVGRADAPAAREAKSPAHAHADDVRRVTIQELKSALEEGGAVVVDVRGKESYERGHIKGSLLLGDGELDRRLQEVPKDKLIVFYCA